MGIFSLFSLFILTYTESDFFTKGRVEHPAQLRFIQEILEKKNWSHGFQIRQLSKENNKEEYDTF